MVNRFWSNSNELPAISVLRKLRSRVKFFGGAAWGCPSKLEEKKSLKLIYANKVCLVRGEVAS